MFRRILSYIFPLSLHQRTSTVSGTLSVTLLNGKKLLNSPNTDYSYGRLQQVLRFGLEQIGFSAIKKQKKILILGIAAGSVVETLVKEIAFDGEIHGVEIAPEVIAIGKQFFDLDKVKNLQLFIQDAQEYVKNTSERYDSIIVDIFQDDQMPSFLFAPPFFLQLNKLLNSNGVILFNTIVKNKSQAQRNRDFVQYFQNTYQITVFPKVKQENQLLLLAKKNLNSSIKR